MQDLKGLYIHIPFCLKKCLYCDFVSYTDCQHLHKKYVDVLCHELSMYKGEQIDTVFVGGGTPTILEASLLDKLMFSVSENFKLQQGYEFTIESNPKTLDADKLKVLKNGGVNRLSIGVQSFFDNELKAIGRVHSSNDAENTILLAKEQGFDNINVDIMSSLPYQTPETLVKSLEKAVSLGVNHISCYSLIIEDETPIAKKYDDGTYVYPSEEDDRKMYYDTKEFLVRNGFKRYEISNYAKDGAECRHNLKYWQSVPYIGAGVAAHSFDGDKRRSNTSNIQEYISGEIIYEENVLTTNDKIEEFMITGLRTVYGVGEDVFLNKFGINMNNMYGQQLDKFIKSGHMEYTNGVYRLTNIGIDISNSVLCEFIL